MPKNVPPLAPPAAAASASAHTVIRAGAAAGILGSVCAGVGNLLHPVTPRDDAEGVAHVVAHSEFWTLIHLVIVVGTVLMVGGLLAIRTVVAAGGRSDALSRLGMHAATIGATVGVITVILDGVAAKQLADQWASAPASFRPIALAVFSASETMNFALAGAFTMWFAGVPFVLFGLAVAGDEVFPRWLGWVAAVAGTGSIGAGLYQAATGRPTTVSLVLTVVGPTVITLWLVVMGVLLWRLSTRT